MYIDVHKAIRRMAPAPKARVPKGHIVTDPDAPAIPEDHLIEIEDEDIPGGSQRDRIGSIGSRGPGASMTSSSPKTTFMMRRSSAGQDGNNTTPIAIRGNANDMREHLKHLGPSNLASRPKTTRYNTVKIKAPGRQSSIVEELYRDNPAPEGGEREGLLKSAGKDASDGVQAVQASYGAIDERNPESIRYTTQGNFDGSSGKRGSSTQLLSTKHDDSDGSDTMASLPSRNSSPARRKRNPARSGSITENIVDAGGIRKVVLETNSSSDDADTNGKNDSVSYGKISSQISLNEHSEDNIGNDDKAHAENGKKKQKRRRKRKGAMKGEDHAKPSGSGQ